MYNEAFPKQYHCNICTGCGRCSKAASSMRVLDFYAQHQRKNLVEGNLTAGEESSNLAKKHIAAVDIGTTTIAMQLRNAGTGEVLDSYTEVNPQRRFGLDVLSRITQVNEYQKKEEMKQAVEEVLRNGIRQFEEKCPRIDLFVAAANTTMVHLALGLDVSRLGEAPFVAETLEEIHTSFENIDTIILPGCDAFVGGDIVSGMYACDMDETEEMTLFLDLGTNGEMALGNRQKIIATATAAAPAFEGGAATGVWGADMVAITAKLLETGMMDETGLLREPYFEEGVQVAGMTVTQEHIRNIQMAKGAVYAGIEILCRQYGLADYSRIDRVLLAGGFGYYLDEKAAVRIGLVPKELEGKIYAVGNSALEGAFMYGKSLCRGMGKEKGLQRLKELTHVINLAKQPEFQSLYLLALNFPAE